MAFGALVLPLAVLGIGSAPLGSRGSGGGVAPLIGLTIPASIGTGLGTGKGGGSGLPVTRGGVDEAGLNSGSADLLGTGDLLLLDLLLSLGLRVAVCELSG